MFGYLPAAQAKPGQAFPKDSFRFRLGHMRAGSRQSDFSSSIETVFWRDEGMEPDSNNYDSP